MAGKVDIQVGIGADARPLEREVAKARGSVHGLARDVESASRKMSISPTASRRPIVTPRPIVDALAERSQPPAQPVVSAVAPAPAIEVPQRMAGRTGIPLPPVYLPPVTKYDPRDRAARYFMPGLPAYRPDEKDRPKYGPLKTAAPPPIPTIPKEVMTGARKSIDAMASASGHLGASAGKAAREMEKAARDTRGPGKAAREMEKAARDTRGPVMPSGRGMASIPAAAPRGGEGLAAKLVRRPEFNFMGRMEGLLGGLTLGGLMMWIRGAEQAAAKTKELARAARLPTEEFIRLQQSAKDNQIPVEVLNDAIKDYADGKITLQQVGEAVGIIGMKAGGASEDVKKLASQIDELAELNKQMEIVREGASNLGKTVTVALSTFFQKISRMAIESVVQKRAVGWWEVGEMMQTERDQTKRQEAASMEKELAEKRATIKVGADLTEFFGDVERGAAEAEKRRVRIKAITEARDEAISRITVQAPRAGDTLARIGGFMGGRMDNRGTMLAERQIQIMEATAKWTEQVAKTLAEG